MKTNNTIIENKVRPMNFIEKGSQLSQQYILDNRKNIVGISRYEVVLLDSYEGNIRLIYIDLLDYRVKYVVYREFGVC